MTILEVGAKLLLQAVQCLPKSRINKPDVPWYVSDALILVPKKKKINLAIRLPKQKMNLLAFVCFMQDCWCQTLLAFGIFDVQTHQISSALRFLLGLSEQLTAWKYYSSFIIKISYFYCIFGRPLSLPRCAEALKDIHSNPAFLVTAEDSAYTGGNPLHQSVLLISLTEPPNVFL